MKNLLFVLFLLLTVSARGEVLVNGVNINDPAQGVAIIQVHVILNSWFIQLPGAPMKSKERNEQTITDADGQKPDVVSLLTVFNFLELNGWEFVIQTEQSVAGGVYIFRRKS